MTTEKRKIKKVLLLTPPAFTFKNFRDINAVPPMGLGYIAAVLEKRGIEVKIFDSLIEGINNEEEIAENVIRIGASFEKIEDEIKRFSPDIVGVSNLFSRQSQNAKLMYELVKKIDQRIIVISGGAHPTVVPQSVLEDKNVDFVVIGEGERTVIDLIDFFEGKKDIGQIDGLGFRKEGKIEIINKKSFIEDLDALPFPSRHLLNMEKYFGQQEAHGKRKCSRFSPIVTSRGCPAGCTFCTAHHVWGKKFRKRSSENVIREMKELKEKYNIEELLIEDDNITLDVERAEEIFDLMIKENFNFKWDTPNGVAAFALNEKLIAKMKKAGCHRLNIAVESGNKNVLKNIIKKPLDLEKVKRLVKYAKKIRLDINIFLVIGMPGETLDEMWDSYLFAKELGLFKPFVSVATPYPGSEIYNICVKNGFLRKDFSFKDLFITSFSISTDKWSAGEVKRIFYKGYEYLQLQYFKRHPLELFKKILGMFFKNPKELLKKIILQLQPIKKYGKN